jgi:hypothetical protein
MVAVRLSMTICSLACSTLRSWRAGGGDVGAILATAVAKRHFLAQVRGQALKMALVQENGAPDPVLG